MSTISNRVLAGMIPFQSQSHIDYLDGSAERSYRNVELGISVGVRLAAGQGVTYLFTKDNGGSFDTLADLLAANPKTREAALEMVNAKAEGVAS